MVWSGGEDFWIPDMPDAQGHMTVAVDFDAVIHQYKGWKGVDVFDDPIPGAVEALKELKSQGCIIILNTTRMMTPKMEEWLERHGVVYDHHNENPDKRDNALDPRKVLADVYIDDRAIQFNGDWATTIRQVLDFKPWFKQPRKEHEDGGGYCEACGLDEIYWGHLPYCPAPE